jgi:hypothetical protein
MVPHGCLVLIPATDLGHGPQGTEIPDSVARFSRPIQIPRAAPLAGALRCGPSSCKGAVGVGRGRVAPPGGARLYVDPSRQRRPLALGPGMPGSDGASLNRRGMRLCLDRWGWLLALKRAWPLRGGGAAVLACNPIDAVRFSRLFLGPFLHVTGASHRRPPQALRFGRSRRFCVGLIDPQARRLSRLTNLQPLFGACARTGSACSRLLCHNERASGWANACPASPAKRSSCDGRRARRFRAFSRNLGFGTGERGWVADLQGAARNRGASVVEMEGVGRSDRGRSGESRSFNGRATTVRN